MTGCCHLSTATLTVVNIEEAKAQRLSNWRQDGKHNLPDSASAVSMIDTMGLVTLYGASPEFPSLLLAHVGSPNYVAEASWDSPAGFVYGWRWDLGKTSSAFYSSIVAKKPTWVSWQLLPTVLAALMVQTEPAELYESGQLSRDAWKIFQALDEFEVPLSTKELRARAGFPTGKENRAAYQKGVEELETQLLLAKVFSPDGEGDEMSHGLVAKLYPDAHRAAMSVGASDTVRRLLLNHVRHSSFVDSALFARHLRLPPAEVQQQVSSLIEERVLEPVAGAKSCYAFKENI